MSTIGELLKFKIAGKEIIQLSDRVEELRDLKKDITPNQTAELEQCLLKIRVLGDIRYACASKMNKIKKEKK